MARPRERSRARAAKSDYQIFVSHATADKWIAKVLCESKKSIPLNDLDDYLSEVGRRVKGPRR